MKNQASKANEKKDIIASERKAYMVYYVFMQNPGLLLKLHLQGKKDHSHLRRIFIHTFTRI